MLITNNTYSFEDKKEVPFKKDKGYGFFENLTSFLKKVVLFAYEKDFRLHFHYSFYFLYSFN